MHFELDIDGTTYLDADGTTSSTTYDLLGRVATASDGKGLQTTTYDPTSGVATQVVDSAAGTFTGSYSADGNLVSQTLPNGLTAETTYDEAGVPVHLRYQKTSNCSSACTWLEYDVQESIHGQWLKHVGTQSTQEYVYDKAGRLTLTKDKTAAGACTTRTYTLDANSNRTSVVTRTPGAGSTCDTTSTGTVKNYSYDTADRLIGAGIEYDALARITLLGSSYAGGGTALTTSYYVNDLIKSQTQDGVTNTYLLDSALRQRHRTRSGSGAGTEIYHYSDGSDAVSWIDRGSSWSRNVTGLDGGLAAIEDSATGTTLQLANLHGDIVATASLSPSATGPLTSAEFDEFGNLKGAGALKYGWLGGKGRRTELPAGVIQMGVRSYVPAIGRFLTPDPVIGGSANAYEYGNGDPVNNVDLGGERAKKRRKTFKGGGGRGGGGSKKQGKKTKNPFKVEFPSKCGKSKRGCHPTPGSQCGRHGVTEACEGTKEDEERREEKNRDPCKDWSVSRPQVGVSLRTTDPNCLDSPGSPGIPRGSRGIPLIP